MTARCQLEEDGRNGTLFVVALIVTMLAAVLSACTGSELRGPTPTATIEATPTPRLPTVASFEPLERPSVGGILVYTEAPAKQDVVGGEFKTAIWVRGVEGLGAFDLTVRADQGLTPTYIAKGQFLGSTGREVVCAPPEYTPTTARLQCVTLRMTPAGAAGEGALAEVTFKGAERSAYDILIERVQMTNVDGSSLFVANTANGRIRLD